MFRFWGFSIDVCYQLCAMVGATSAISRYKDTFYLFGVKYNFYEVNWLISVWLRSGTFFPWFINLSKITYFLCPFFMCVFISRIFVYLHILTWIFAFMMIFADFQAGNWRGMEKSEKAKLISRNYRYCKKSQQTKSNQPLLFLLQQGIKNPTEIEDL